MTRQIFIVTTVIFDSNDSNLWTSSKAFAEEKAAKEYFEEEGQKVLSDAQGAEELESDDYYDVSTSKSSNTFWYERTGDCPVYYKVEIYSQELAL